MSLLGIDFAQFLADLLGALLYPLEVIFGHIYVIFFIIVNSITGLINNFFRLFDAVSSFVNTFLSTWLPSPWIVLILLMLTIASLLRLYWFLKDVEIWGFKI